MHSKGNGRWGVFFGAALTLSTASGCGAGNSPADDEDSAEHWEYGPGPLVLADPDVGLSDLSSYTATLRLVFDGTNAGQPEAWSYTYVMVVTPEPVARQLTIKSTGDAADPEKVYRAEMGGVAYERVGTDGCTATSVDPEDQLADQWEPAGFLAAVIGAEEAGGDTIDGVAADHYTFDERAFGPLPPNESTGDLWLSDAGGYLAEYAATTVASAEYFGEGVEGTLTWDYRLTEVGQPLTVDVPDDCPAGPA